MKITNTKLFETNDNFFITAQSFETRTGWGHIVTIQAKQSLNTLGYCKINYLNRTWESYQYQSAILGAINDAIETQLKRLKGTQRLTKQRRKEFMETDYLLLELQKLYKEYK